MNPLSQKKSPGEIWHAWLRTWLTCHPLKNPPEFLRHSYTEEVMSRIRSQKQKRPAFGWIPIPRFTFALGTALACLLMTMVCIHRSPSRYQLAQNTDQNLSSEETPIGQTLDLLDQVAESDEFILTEEESPSSHNQDLLEELHWLDETELAVS